VSPLETLAVAVVVGLAAVYLGRRLVRVAAGGPCGCGAASKSGCPAASRVADDLERVAREADARH